MLKYIAILGVNLFLLYCCVLFFIDNKLISKEPLLLLRTLFFTVLVVWISYNVVSIYVLRKEREESALVYKVVATSKRGALGFYEHIQPFKKEFIMWTWLTVGCVVLGLVSMGMTGYVWLAIPEKLGWVKAITGDNTWPAAVGMAVTWPLLFPIAVLVKHYLIRAGHIAYSVPGFWGVVVVGIVALVVLIYSGADSRGE